jgi:hypothetical protein
MTFWKFILLSFLQWAILAGLKAWYFEQTILSGTTGYLVYFVLTGAVVAAIIRRFGVINYLESILLLGLWVLGNIFLDLFITVNLAGLDLVGNWQYWVGTVVAGLSVFLFHKKRHIQIRKEQHHHH